MPDDTLNSRADARAAFTAPALAKSIDPVQRFGMEMNGGTLYVVLCGGFPTLSAYLYFRENVAVYHVSNVEELRELLTGADGIPADLAVIYSQEFQILPPLTFRSPVDDHKSMVLFMPDMMAGDEARLNEIYALTDQLLKEKVQFIEGFSAYSRNHPSNKEDKGK